MAFDDIRPVNQDILFDAYGEAIGTTTVGVARALQVDVVQSVPVSGTITADQGLKSTSDNGWPVVLYDANGNPVMVKHGDGYDTTQSGVLMHGQDAYGSGVKVLQTIEDVSGGINRLAVDARIAPGSSIVVGTPIPDDLSDYLIIPLTNGSGSDSMIVNGSVTPVEFTVKAPDISDGYDIALGELRIVVSTQDFTFDGNSFGSQSELANGVVVEIVAGDSAIIVIRVHVNEDFLFFPSTAGITLNNTGPKDILMASIQLGGGPIMYRGSSDKVSIKIQDNITGGGATEFNYFKARLYATKVNN